MKLPLFILLALSSSALAFQSPSQSPAAPPAQSAALRAQVADWIASTLAASADAKIAQRLPVELDAILASSRNIRIILDSGIARDSTARIAFTWGGRLHAFNITDDQARLTGVSAAGALANDSGLSNEASQPITPFPVQISELKLDNPAAVDGKTPITGSFKIKAVGKLPPGQLVVRVATRYEEGILHSFRFLDALPADGKLTFSVSALNADTGSIHFGPIPIVIDVLATDQKVGEGLVASNALGLVADLLPDADGFIRAGIDLMKNLTAILASVTDKPSAAKAVSDYKALVLRNQSLSKIFDRLNRLPPDLEEKLTAKYSAQIDQLTANMQQEYNRLLAADYAGEPFFDSLDAAVKAELKN